MGLEQRFKTSWQAIPPAEDVSTYWVALVFFELPLFESISCIISEMKKKETNKSKHVKQMRNPSTDFQWNIFIDSDDDDNVDDDDNAVDVLKSLLSIQNAML